MKEKILPGTIVVHRFRNLQLFEFKKEFESPKGIGVVVQDLGESCCVLWEDLGVQIVDKRYLVIE